MKHKTILLLLAFAAIFLASCSAGDTGPRQKDGLRPGDHIPAFAAVTTGNAAYTDETFIGSGGPFAIVLFDPDNAPCRDYLARLGQVLPAYHPILAFSTGEPQQTTGALTSAGLDIPAVASTDKETIGGFTKGPLPATFVFDDKGTLRHRINASDELSDEELLRVLEDNPGDD